MTNTTPKTGPNILICGTPGVGKTTLAAELATRTGLTLQSVSEIAKENSYYEGFDEELQTNILNEDAILDELEPAMCGGGNVVEYHGCEWFPERWFDIVFVLRTTNDILYDRLKQRGYDGAKLENNIQCEIFQTLLDEARASYPAEIVHELPSNTPDDMENSLERIMQWMELWKQQH